MTKIKVENNFIWIILAAIRIYSTNFLKFCGYMLFPVLGQVLGLLLIFCLAALYIAYLPELADKYPIFNDYTTIILSVILITVPGLLIFTKAFWDYLVTYGAINSVTESFLNTRKIYDFPAHNATITSRVFKYIGLWCLYSIFWLIAINPFFWIIGAIFFIYFILIFQVFSFEPDKSVSECFTRSFQIVRGNAFRTLLIMLIIGLFTHVIFVQGFAVIFDFTKITPLLASLFEGTLTTYIPIDAINNFMLNINPSFDMITPTKVASFFVYQIVAFLVVGFSLPLRGITWALWYIALTGNSGMQEKSSSKRTVKRVSAEVINRARKQQ